MFASTGRAGKGKAGVSARIGRFPVGGRPEALCGASRGFVEPAGKLAIVRGRTRLEMGRAQEAVSIIKAAGIILADLGNYPRF